MVAYRISIILRNDKDLQQIGLTKEKISQLNPYGNVLIKTEGKYHPGFNLLYRLLFVSDTVLFTVDMYNNRFFFVNRNSMLQDAYGDKVITFERLTTEKVEWIWIKHFCDSRNIDCNCEIIKRA